MGGQKRAWRYVKGEISSMSNMLVVGCGGGGGNLGGLRVGEGVPTIP